MSKRNWFNELQAAANQYPHLAWAIDRMSVEYSSAQQWKPVAASLSSGCAEQQGRIEELEKQLETVTAKLDAYCKASVMKVDYDKLKKQLEAVRLEHRKEYDRAEMETGRAKDAEAQLDAVRNLHAFEVPHAPVGAKAVWVSDLNAALQGEKE